MDAAAWLWWCLGYGVWVLGCSVTLAALVWWDKRKAAAGGWRVRESVLHGWELAGGWPGGAWARRRWRHKTVKRRYVWWSRAALAGHVGLVLAGVWVLRAF